MNEKDLLIEALTALRDLRAEVDQMTKRIGWSGYGARERSDQILERAVAQGLIAGKAATK